MRNFLQEFIHLDQEYYIIFSALSRLVTYVD